MRYIDTIVQKYKMLTMFEMFSSQIFAPGQQSGISRSSSQNGKINSLIVVTMVSLFYVDNCHISHCM